LTMIFLISEFRDLSTTTITGPSSFLSFCLFGASLPLLPSAPPSLVSTVRLPAFVSSLVAFKLDLKRGSECARGGMFAPLMRQETVLVGERKYHPNMRTAIVYTHFSNAYTPARRVSKEEVGVTLTFWTDPVVCGGPSEPRRMAVRMRLDVYESVRKIMLRYRTALVSLPAGWLALIMSVQMRRLGENGSVLSFPAAFSLLIREDLGRIMLAVGGAQLVQSAVLQTRYSALHDGPPATNFALVHPPRIVADLLLGQAHSAFILLDWLLLLVSIGWLACVSLLLHVFIWVCASLSTHLLPRALGPSLDRRRKRTPSSASPAAHEPRPSMIDYPTLGFLAVVKLFSLLYIPYHLGFLLLTVMQLVTTVQSLVSCAQSDSIVDGEKEKKATSRYWYNMSVLLGMVWLLPMSVVSCMVWLRNLQEGWYGAFSDGCSPLTLLGMGGICYVNRLEELQARRGRRRRRTSSGLWGLPASAQSSLRPLHLPLVWTFRLVGWLALLFGIRATFLIFHSFNFAFLLVAFFALLVSRSSAP